MRTDGAGPDRHFVIEPDRSIDSIGLEVVEAVATVTGARLETMPRLSEVVDLDALDRLFTQSRTGVAAFRYCGVLVYVEADGRISIYEADDGAPARP